MDRESSLRLGVTWSPLGISLLTLRLQCVVEADSISRPTEAFGVSGAGRT